jgi:hypothetical protein
MHKLSQIARQPGPVPFRTCFTCNSWISDPSEIWEKRWRLEAEVVEKPGRIEMREMYKELNGRKSKVKGKLGGTVGKGGWAGGQDWTTYTAGRSR